MIRDDQKNKLLEELERTPFILHASKKIGIDKSTIYRWMKKDKKFKDKVEESLNIGRTSLCDFAESKLVKKIEEEDFRAIKFYLENNEQRFIKPRQVTIFNTNNKGREVLTNTQKDKLDKLLNDLD